MVELPNFVSPTSLQKNHGNPEIIAGVLGNGKLDKSMLSSELQYLSTMISPLIYDIRSNMPRVMRDKEYLEKHLGNPSLQQLRTKKNIHYTGACLEYCRVLMDGLSKIPEISNVCCDTFLCWETTHNKFAIPLSIPVIHTTVSFTFQQKQYSLDNMQATSFHLYPGKAYFKKFTHNNRELSSNQSVKALFQATSLRVEERPDNMSYLTAMAKKYPKLTVVTKFFRDRQVQRYVKKLEKDRLIEFPYLLRVFPRGDEGGCYEEEC